MIIYIGYECYYDYAEVWRKAMHAFKTKSSAEHWVAQTEETNTNWREIESIDLIE